MIDSERAELNDMIDRAFTDLGGRATKAEIINVLRLPAHLKDFCARQGLKTVVGLYLRKLSKSGLPQAPAVDGEGNHAQLELMTIDDCRFLVAAYRVRGEANYRRAEQIVEFCAARYDVAIDIENPLGEQVAS